MKPRRIAPIPHVTVAQRKAALQALVKIGPVEFSSRKSAKPRSRFKTYTVARARRQFAQLLADVAAGCIVEIVDKGRAVASMLDSDTLETLEILANPDAMKAIRAAKAGKTKYYPVNWGPEPKPKPPGAKQRNRKAKP